MIFGALKRASLAVLAAVLLLPLHQLPARGVGLSDSCAALEVVYARGSGQTVGEGEANRLKSQLTSRISDASLMHWYELGSDPSGYGGHTYQAVDVGNVWNANPIGAKFSSGYANDYGKSVDSGVGELYNYFLQRLEKCKGSGSKFAFSGYSQGAQVVGQTLEKLNTEAPDSLNSIDFAAMFGDPKLHLPEGEGFNPPACRGKDLSPYRRLVPDCNTDNGYLGARKPYLPSVMRSKSGLWCNDDDFVCGSSQILGVASGHGQYRDPGNGADEAARVIAGLLQKRLPTERQPDVDTSIRMLGSGTTGLDVVFLIDTTGSMGGEIEAAKVFASTMADTVSALRGRVALVAYRDLGDTYTATIVSGLGTDVAVFRSGLTTLYADGGGDTPEAALHALTTTLNGLDWRPAATKAAVLLTDAGFHEPDLVDGSTEASVALRALQIDPVNVYPVVPSWVAPEYQKLAELTTGQVIVNSGDTATALTTALTRISERPVALLRQNAYFGRPGDSFTFDASPSYSTSSTIVRYDWDFEGDGTFDLTTTTPTADHVYLNAVEAIVQVKVADAAGLVSNFSAPVHVGTGRSSDEPAAPTNLTASATAVPSSVTLAWTPGDDRAVAWALAVNGVAIGKPEASTTTVEIVDLDRAVVNTLAVAAIDKDGQVGTFASIELQPVGTAGVRTVPFDVMPGSTDSTIHASKKGVVPGAILSSSDFDATKVDIAATCIAPLGSTSRSVCAEKHGKVHVEDVNRDGRPDAVLHYDVTALQLSPSDTALEVTGRLTDGTQFRGSDTIRVRR